MRVCMFIMLLPQHIAGGMEQNAWDLARGIANIENDVTIITSRHPEGKDRETIDGVSIHYCDVKPSSKLPLGKKCLKTFEKLHNAEPFDIVHSQSFSAHWLVASGMKEKLGIPLVTTMHGIAATAIKSNLNQGLSAMLPFKIAYHIFCHHFRTNGLIRGSDAVIAISDELVQRIPDEFGISIDRVHKVYNGIDDELFAPRESPLSEDYKDKKIILAVSVLHRQKGIHHLIKAFQCLSETMPDLCLIIVGVGPYEDELRDMSKGYENKIEFCGKVPNDRLWEYYDLCDIFVMPTLAFEGLPLTLLEAMACAKPVIASDTGGISSVISDDADGILIRKGNEKGIASALERVLKDPEFANRLGMSARKKVEESFSLKGMAKKTVEVYESVI